MATTLFLRNNIVNQVPMYYSKHSFVTQLKLTIFINCSQPSCDDGYADVLGLVQMLSTLPGMTLSLDTDTTKRRHIARMKQFCQVPKNYE